MINTTHFSQVGSFSGSNAAKFYGPT